MKDKKTCLIIQSGAMGDIFIVAPIARQYYLKGYLVYWPVRQKYFNFVSNYLPYVSAMLITDDKFESLNNDWLRSDTMHLLKIAARGHYDVVLNLADRGDKSNELSGETFEETKYRLSGIPFSFKNHLLWDKKADRVHALKKIIEETYPEILESNYVVAHLESSHGDRTSMPEHETRTIIEITQIPGFEICDWYDIISKSVAIYCVESSVHQFIDGSIHRLLYDNPQQKFYLLSRSSLQPGQRYTKSENWDKTYMK